MFETVNLAWAAGFIDGEGHICVQKKVKTSARIQVAQKTVECLEKLQKIFNCGSIIGPYRKPQGHVIYFWQVTKTSEVDNILTLLWPYLSTPKKEQAIQTGFVFGVIRKPKKGAPLHKTISKCHPNERHVALGLCQKCYHRNRYRRLHNVDISKLRVNEL